MQTFDQFYYMMCATEGESIAGLAGYGLSASSKDFKEVQSSQLEQTLAELARYDCPKELHDTQNTPMRLARIRSDNQFALVCSNYRRVPGDRPHTSFSHIVLTEPGAVTPAEVLESWNCTNQWGGKNGWVWSVPEDQKKRGKKLPRWHLSGYSSRRFLSPEHLLGFVFEDVKSLEQDGHTPFALPNRLIGHEHLIQRRRLLQETLAQFLNGQHIILRAEPNLAAMIIYGVTQLLPPRLTLNLTFSTYESKNDIDRSDTTITACLCELTEHQLKGRFKHFYLDSFIEIEEQADLGDPINSYAAEAVKMLAKGDLRQLHEFWDFYHLRENTTNDFQPFLSDWSIYYRLRSVQEGNQLSEEELVTYVNDDRLRGLLFTTPAGKQAVNTAGKNLSAWRDWWIEGRSLYQGYLPLIGRPVTYWQQIKYQFLQTLIWVAVPLMLLGMTAGVCIGVTIGLLQALDKAEMQLQSTIFSTLDIYFLIITGFICILSLTMGTYLIISKMRKPKVKDPLKYMPSQRSAPIRRIPPK